MYHNTLSIKSIDGLYPETIWSRSSQDQRYPFLPLVKRNLDPFPFVNIISADAYDDLENDSNFTSAALGSSPSSVSNQLIIWVITPMPQNEKTVLSRLVVRITIENVSESNCRNRNLKKKKRTSNVKQRAK